MHFYNMDKIADNINIHNKYLLTSVIAHRARQISETKGRNILDKASEEKYISLALADMEAGIVAVNLQTETIPDVIENEVNLTERENEDDLPKNEKTESCASVKESIGDAVSRTLETASASGTRAEEIIDEPASKNETERQA